MVYVCVMVFVLVCMQYIAKLMEWIEKQINNEDLFPVQVGETNYGT